MKNIIKIATSALIVFLTLGSVAFAEPSTNGGSSGSVNSAPSTNGGSTGSANSAPSTNGGSVGSTHGTAPSTPTDNGGSSNGSSHRGGGYTRNVTLANVKVTVAGNKATVTWDTTPASKGMVVYGPLSLTTPTTATSFYGYAAGTVTDEATLSHTHTFTMAPGVTYFVRSVAFVGSRAVFGSEIKVNRAGTSVITGAPAVGTIFDAPAKTVIDSKIPSDVEVSKATTTTNVAAAVQSHSKIGAFFKKLWNSIIAPFCK